MAHLSPTSSHFACCRTGVLRQHPRCVAAAKAAPVDVSEEPVAAAAAAAAAAAVVSVAVAREEGLTGRQDPGCKSRKFENLDH